MTSAGFALDETPRCGTCGTVYDGRSGDPLREVPPGVSFGRLPAHWRCPGCGGPQHGFFPAAPGADPMRDRVDALVAAYRVVADTDMKGLSVCNTALAVEAVGFREITLSDGGFAWLGMLIAPWTLNAVLVPHAPARWMALNDGDQTVETLPAGAFAFKAARVGALGTLAVISAVSDMTLLRDQDDAREAAHAALDALLVPKTAEETPEIPEPSLPPAPPPVGAKPAKPPRSRRALFGGRG
ncbi:[NiFe]-hydrogenase assembly chaperone HybE [Azospirillum sp.]|uniref:[NiFe]-hydrogenase assembly chaperone HybE n=1 Tax=Azospirillum sp. TaxID=34012 RepID=UPI003D7574FB